MQQPDGRLLSSERKVLVGCHCSGTSGTGKTHIAKRLWGWCQRPSDWTAEKINTLANVRVGKWTILTSNLSMVQIAKVDKRIASRMVRNKGIVADVNTKDYNLR